MSVQSADQTVIPRLMGIAPRVDINPGVTLSAYNAAQVAGAFYCQHTISDFVSLTHNARASLTSDSNRAEPSTRSDTAPGAVHPDFQVRSVSRHRLTASRRPTEWLKWAHTARHDGQVGRPEDCGELLKPGHKLPCSPIAPPSIRSWISSAFLRGLAETVISYSTPKCMDSVSN